MSSFTASTTSIRVVARVKPCDAEDESKKTLLIGDDGLSLYYQPPTSASSLVASPLRSPARYKVFAFDTVINNDTTQATTYTTSGLEAMVGDVCLHGVNGTVICCGQQGTGKTYTLFGNENMSVTTTGVASVQNNPSSSVSTLTPSFNRYAAKALAMPPLDPQVGQRSIPTVDVITAVLFFYLLLSSPLLTYLFSALNISTLFIVSFGPSGWSVGHLSSVLFTTITTPNITIPVG